MLIAVCMRANFTTATLKFDLYTVHKCHNVCALIKCYYVFQVGLKRSFIENTVFSKEAFLTYLVDITLQSPMLF